MAAEYHRRFDPFGGRVIFGALSRLVLKLSPLIRGPGVTRTMCLEIISLPFLGFRARHLANRGITDPYVPSTRHWRRRGAADVSFRFAKMSFGHSIGHTSHGSRFWDNIIV